MLNEPELSDRAQAAEPKGLGAEPSLLLRRAKRITIAVLGGTVVVVGIVMIVLPGPAILIIPAGLAILATEFAFARRWLAKCRSLMRRKPGPPATAVPEK